ncbi:GNAT family N-acetyltransferase [Oscillatoria sp. CS-180]|uniref:GNAT family N-acetyltransferase n=1 Tax=Oscillatoria sp. CS-180 TaxID=3021720 RepID=UPI00232F88B3|nr:GNAT family N-acetyltransferase [Oscillatoria sp. CS-180]MDB9527794.1 GNAT family N-acetyltransferase [Oscillatoria sp. CS-180]
MPNPTSSSTVTISSATPDDVPAIFQLIHALADYEKLAHEVVGTQENLARHLFGDRPFAECLLARVEGTPVGLALFFHNYSTFLMKPGIYLEDLFVLPDYRGRGIGKLLLQHLGKIAVERDCGRLEWNVLDWNEPAIAFYKKMGAQIKPEWHLCRVTGEALSALASL